MARRTSSRHSRSWLLTVSLTVGALAAAQLLIASTASLAASGGSGAGSPGRGGGGVTDLSRRRAGLQRP